MKHSNAERSSTSLSRASQYILLALAGNDLHGYGIIQQARHLSEGGYSIGPGTLYDNLKKLIDAGLVIDAPHSGIKQKGDDRRFFRITAQGLSALDQEIAKLQEMVAIHSRLRSPRNA